MTELGPTSWVPPPEEELWLRGVREKYEISARLGGKGAVRVYRARPRDAAASREVSLKVAALQIQGTDWDTLRLHDRGARILRGLTHPGIPALVDAFATDEIQVVVTEFAEGNSLAELLESGRYRLDERRSLELLVQAAEILHYLHELRPPIIHRDVKPANLILGGDGRLRLIDFDAATDDPRVRVTGGATLVGTVGYVPLEQYEGRASPQSDVFALGATFAHLMTGIPPHEMPRKNLVPDLSGLYLSAGMAALLTGCLAVDPDQRPTTAEVIRRARALIAQPGSSQAVGPPGETARDARTVGAVEPRAGGGAAGEARAGSAMDRFEALWTEFARDPTQAEARRALVRLAALIDAHKVASERLADLGRSRPELTGPIGDAKRELINHVAAKMLVTHRVVMLQDDERSTARLVRTSRGVTAGIGALLFFLYYRTHHPGFAIAGLVMLALGVALGHQISRSLRQVHGAGAGTQEFAESRIRGSSFGARVFSKLVENPRDRGGPDSGAH